MPDISDIQAAQSVKVIGANSTGVEQTPVQSTALGDLHATDALKSTGTQGTLTVGTSAVEAKVGVSALTNRKLLAVYNESNATIFWGLSNAVTITTGIPIVKDQEAQWSALETASVWLIAGSAGNTVRVVEGA